MSSIKNSDEWLEDKNARSIAFFSVKRPVLVNRELIEELKNKSKENGNANIRLCLHSSPEEELHDMVILEYQDKKCRKPHKHLAKDETLHIIEGKMIVLLFDENGGLISRETLDSENNFAYRAPIGTFHVWLPLTEYAVYREIKQGPFSREDNIPPSWDHAKVLQNNVDFMDLTCYNSACKTPCSLNIKFKK